MGLDEWKTYLEHGEEFYLCAKGGYERPEKFNEDALFNLAAMAIEKYSMGYLMKNGILPEGHTFQDITEKLDSVIPLSEDLKEELLGLDKYQQSFCSLEIFRPDPITRENIPPMLGTCEKLRKYVKGPEGLSA
ncbi:MAG: hypothetical protein JXA95_19175 [Spirochaetales bacterium]|nr:hypothetical protein [Spirochaetales bacterium]